MSIEIIALALTCILAVIILALYRKCAKSLRRHDSSEAALQQRCDDLSQQVNDKHATTSQMISALRRELEEKEERFSAAQDALSERITAVNDEAMSAIELTEKDVIAYSERVFHRASDYTNLVNEDTMSEIDQTKKDVIAYSEEIFRRASEYAD